MTSDEGKCITVWPRIPANNNTMNNLGIRYAVVQAPPIYAVQFRHRYQEREVVKFNTKLEGRLKDKLISMEELEDDRSLIDRIDGIHLTSHSSQLVATLIENHIKKHRNVAVDRTIAMDRDTVLVTLLSQPPLPPRQIPDPQTTTTGRFKDTVELVETDTRRAGKIIAQGGNRIKKFKLAHRVKIVDNVDNKTDFLIRGDEERTTKARTEMYKLMDNIKRDDDTRDQVPDRTGDTSCRYHQAGNCRYGTRCHYRHDLRPTDILTITLPPQSQPQQGRGNRPTSSPSPPPPPPPPHGQQETTKETRRKIQNQTRPR